MIQQSLNSIMNEMAHGDALSDFMPFDAEMHGPELEELSELDAFALKDGLLESLQKEYLEAKAQRIELCKLAGTDDAMSVVAMDMEDSAWCAMQTRYVELREDRDMMREVQSMMRRCKQEVAEKKKRAMQSCFERKSRHYSFYLRMMSAIKAQHKTPQIFEWNFACLLFLGEQSGFSANQPSYQFAVA